MTAAVAKAKKRPTGKRQAGEKALPTKGMQARERIISVAESIFNKQGVDGASMRDIAAAAKMQPASMYYHFVSKDELVWAVWQKGGVDQIERINAAIAGEKDPWRRMEIACITHVSGLLDWRRANQVLFVMPPWLYPESIKARVIALRNEYEQVFVDLINDLPLRAGTDRRYLRLALIGALSWSLYWFKKDRDTPAMIGRQMLAMIRSGIDPK
jgi:TetR/AcrR family transcriptional regulator, cholesterol catabolism regulator